MNKYLVLGAGKMGVVLATDLIESNPQNTVTLVDINFDNLNRAAQTISSERLIPVQRDIEDESQRNQVFEGQDVGLCALLHRHSLKTLETAVKMGVHFVDLIGEFTLEKLKFEKDAKAKGLTLLSGIGVSPGITNICVGRGVNLLDEAEDALIFVGGNPVEPKPPLRYRIVYAVNSLLNLYERTVPILRNGQCVEVSPMSGVESLEFSPPFEKMECFYTDGLNSLIHTMLGKLNGELSEKTVRHVGHSEEIKTLMSCGLFSRETVQVYDKNIRPRDVLEVLLDSELRLGSEKDATLMRIKVIGKKAEERVTHVFEMLDYFDEGKNYTSMAKTTSFPASIAAQMISQGIVTQRGVVFPENVFHAELYDTFVAELQKRGVLITHKTFLKENI